METYDRAEIVEDCTKLRVYFFRGDERVSGQVYDLRSDYADEDIDEIRTEITTNYGIPPAQISKRVKPCLKTIKRKRKSVRGRSR